jgi:4-carboxymuconolactone decarboxylase
MRLPLLDPQDLTAEQKPLYADMTAGIAQSFGGFKAVDREGRLLGPWNPWLHDPRTGGPVWELTRTLSANSCLPANIRHLALLVVSVDFDAAYAIHADIAVAENAGFSQDRLQTLLAGDKPDDLSPDEETAHDVTFTLIGGGALPDDMYAATVAAFGEKGAYELITLVGLYCMIAVTLNGFDVPVPDESA